MFTLGTDAAEASVGISESLSFIALSGTESNALTTSFARDSREFSNTVPSLSKDRKRMITIKSCTELHYFYVDGHSGSLSGDEEDKVPSCNFNIIM